MIHKQTFFIPDCGLGPGLTTTASGAFDLREAEIGQQLLKDGEEKDVFVGKER